MDLSSTSSTAHEGDGQSFPYFKDGNVVISLQTADGKTRFHRIHMSILSLHSLVFADMFDLPALSDASETYDGVPLIRLPDDAEDVSSLLKVIYDPTAISWEPLNPDMPILVKGILKLVDKYQIDSIRPLIVKQLEKDWPQTLEQWDRLEAEIAMLQDARLEAVKGAGGAVADLDLDLDGRLPEPAAAIRLARECDIPSILPAAFYHLSRIDPRDEWVKWRGELNKQTQMGRLKSGARSARWELLGRDDLFCVLMIKTRLKKAGLTTVQNVPVPMLLRRWISLQRSKKEVPDSTGHYQY